jgi:hypothetical protein
MRTKQTRNTRRAAAWTAPIVQAYKERKAHQAHRLAQKQTHKLPPMACVLWLPEYGAYVKTVNRRATAFTVCPTPDGALCLNDDQAEVTGQDLAFGAGIRVHLRPFNQMH